jgi:hypothetical protein
MRQTEPTLRARSSPLAMSFRTVVWCTPKACEVSEGYAPAR